MRRKKKMETGLKLWVGVAVLFAAVFAVAVGRDLYRSRNDSAHQRDSPLQICRIRSEIFTTDIGMKRSTLMEPRGTPIHAVVPGTIRKLFFSVRGGNTIYEFDETGMYCYYYAHLEGYAEGLREGMRVERGDVIGFVGSTGNADARAPHSAFCNAFELGPEKQWSKGTAIDPYASLGRRGEADEIANGKTERSSGAKA